MGLDENQDRTTERSSGLHETWSQSLQPRPSTIGNNAARLPVVGSAEGSVDTSGVVVQAAFVGQ